VFWRMAAGRAEGGMALDLDEVELPRGVSRAGEALVLVRRDEEAREISMWTVRLRLLSPEAEGPALWGVRPAGEEWSSPSDERGKDPDRRGRTTCTQSVTSSTRSCSPSSCGLAIPLLLLALSALISICVHMASAAGSIWSIRSISGSKSSARSDPFSDRVDDALYCECDCDPRKEFPGGARCWS